MTVLRGIAITDKRAMILTNKQNNMKKILITATAGLSSLVFGQITIGKTIPSVAPVNEFVSIEFGNSIGGKGIIVPWVTNTAALSAPVPGTLIFDSSDQRLKFGIGSTAGSTSISE